TQPGRHQDDGQKNKIEYLNTHQEKTAAVRHNHKMNLLVVGISNVTAKRIKNSKKANRQRKGQKAKREGKCDPASKQSSFSEMHESAEGCARPSRSPKKTLLASGLAAWLQGYMQQLLNPNKVAST
ncbi:MAG: hypothetical protein QW594_03030, partial [Candidatus Woesearchaeota archaeon]